MANVKDIKAKTITVTLSDGVEYKLRYTLNALAELEDRYGSIDEAFEKLDAGSIKAVRCVLWAGMLHDQPNITEAEVGDRIDVQYLQDLTAIVGEALGVDMPEPEKLTNPN